MDQTTTFYLTQGVLGVSCIALSVVVIKLYGEVVRLNTALLNMSTTNSDKYTTMTEKLAVIISSNSESNRILAEKIESSKQGRA